MNADQIRILMASLLYVVILATGIWLSRAGRPHNQYLLAFHKLVSLGAAVYLAVGIYDQGTARGTAWGSGSLIVSLVTGALFLGTMITGGLLTIDDKPPAPLVRRLHQIGPLLTVLGTAVTLYLLR